MFQKILWATDFSPHARDAGRRALECARCSHRPVDVLTVVSPDELPLFLLDVPDPFIPSETVHEAEQRLKAEHEERIRRELAAETAFLVEAGVPVQLHVRVGSPADEIIRLATELGTDLIVMGSHGRRSLEELLLGSTVENVTRHAPCPVLVVR
jgi:nucleotide-binding universal stress UspA family protein